MKHFILISLLMFCGCVQTAGPVPLPSDPSVTPVKPVEPQGASELTKRIVADLQPKVQPGDQIKLRKYAATYLCASEVLAGTEGSAAVVLQAVRKMPEIFVQDRLPYMAEELKLVMPETGDPEPKRAEISKAFKAVSDACLILAGG